MYLLVSIADESRTPFNLRIKMVISLLPMKIYSYIHTYIHTYTDTHVLLTIPFTEGKRVQLKSSKRNVKYL
jgi:hypothetical protein